MYYGSAAQLAERVASGNAPGSGPAPRTYRDDERIAFASGGIVTRPTRALIGESGPEAVIPLNRMGAMGRVELNVNVTVEGSVVSAGDLADVVIEEVQLAADRGELRLGRVG